MAPVDAATYIDLDRYPIGDPDTAGYRRLVSGIRAELAEDGCAVLRGFIPEERVGELAREAEAVAGKGHRSSCRTNAFVPADIFGEDSILRAIYEWSRFPAFIQAALGETRFYRYADPLADVIINVVEEGEGFPWHFDTNNYTVTLAIQNGIEGGEFEYCPNLRTPTDENYPGVQEVLDGGNRRPKTLRLGAGDLQIFKGRYSLHRVKPVKGARKRFVGIFSFVEEPGMVGSPERTRQLYGRVLPIHEARAGRRADQLVD